MDEVDRGHWISSSVDRNIPSFQVEFDGALYGYGTCYYLSWFPPPPHLILTVHVFYYEAGQPTHMSILVRLWAQAKIVEFLWVYPWNHLF